MKKSIENDDDVLEKIQTPLGVLTVLKWSRMKTTYGMSETDNLWLVNESGQRLWVAKRQIDPRFPNLKGYKEPFTFISQGSKGEWIGRTYSGEKFLIDISNGISKYAGWGGR